MEQIKINKLEIENVKRIKAVQVVPTGFRPLAGISCFTCSIFTSDRSMDAGQTFCTTCTVSIRYCLPSSVTATSCVDTSLVAPRKGSVD